jgi:hypothetical protein
MLAKANMLNVTIILDSLDQESEPFLVGHIHGNLSSLATNSGTGCSHRNVAFAERCPQQQLRFSLNRLC